MASKNNVNNLTGQLKVYFCIFWLGGDDQASAVWRPHASSFEKETKKSLWT